MDRSIRSIEWKSPGGDAFVDVTAAIKKGVVSATPHPDEDVDDPKGYSIKLTLQPDSTAFAEALREGLMALDPARVSVRLEGVDATIADVPVGVTKVPHLGEQNEAELSVKPEGHDLFHEYF